MRSWLKLTGITSYNADHRKMSSERLNLEPLEQRQLLSNCHVNRLGDAGSGFGFRGDLRYCINKVNDEPGPDTIMFRPNAQGTIALTGPLPDLASDIDIQGPGEELLTIDAQQIARVFNVVATGNVEISGLTLTQGRTPNYEKGGGIYNAGKLTLQDCTISDNKGWIEGGGVYNRGTLSISGCSISGNTGLSKGGGRSEGRTA